MTSVIQDLQSRGLIAQTTDIEALDALLNEQKSPFTAVSTDRRQPAYRPLVARVGIAPFPTRPAIRRLLWWVERPA